MKTSELDQRIHIELRCLVESSPWRYVSDLDARARLRAAGLKARKLRYGDGNRRVMVVFPSWAVELLEHPKCSKRMLTGARHNIPYRKEKQMETRFIKRRTVRLREQQMTNMVVHHSAIKQFSQSPRRWRWRNHA